MTPTIAIIAPGAMGAAVGGRLAGHGLTVLTSLAGRSEASAARARAFGLRPVGDAEAASADLLLSIVPPGDALALAHRLAPHLAAAPKKPLYVDCNAVSPETAAEIGAVLEEVRCPYVDAGIIGLPPQPEKPGPRFYAAGADAQRFAELRRYGLDIVVLDGPIGAASALKMSYAGCTKGLTALGTTMILAATRAGAAAGLRAELERTQPELLRWLSRSIPAMFAKAYRFAGEMEEIRDYVGTDFPEHQLYQGAAELYARLAEDFAGERVEITALEAFLKPKG